MLSNLSCFIIDDLPESIDTLSLYIERTPELVLMGSSTSAIPFLQMLREGRVPDILFLDIEMPEIDGISLAKQLRNQCRIILVSGHTEKAIEGYDADCIDFLSKPLAFHRFYEGVHKVIRLIKAEQTTISIPPAPSSPVVAEPLNQYPSSATPEANAEPVLSEEIFAVPGELQGSKEFIKFSEIIYLEIQKGEISLYSTNNRKHKDRRTLISMAAILPDYFLQIERRCIINLRFLKSATRTRAFLEGLPKGLSIGISYQNEVKSYLARLRRMQ